MVGRLGRNLRKGHLAEDLGIGVLRGFAAVASIRQEDDVGLDAIATLLEPHGKFLYAGSSFGVQFKAASVTEVRYDNQQIDWFLSQQIPYFIGRVDLKSGGFALYPTSPARQFLLHRREAESVILTFDKPPRQHSERSTLEGDKIRVLLGPPILECTEQEARTDDFALRASSLVADWVTMEQRNIELAKIGRGVIPSWTTWRSPTATYKYSRGGSHKLPEYMSAAEPYLAMLAQHFFFAEGSERFEEALAFILLARWFREHGVDVDFDFQLDWRVKWPRKSALLGNASPPPFPGS